MNHPDEVGRSRMSAHYILLLHVPRIYRPRGLLPRASPAVAL